MHSTEREESQKREHERKRKRYAQMNANEKNEVLAKKHVAYQQKIKLAGKEILSCFPVASSQLDFLVMMFSKLSAQIFI
jgi:hypothetical protein